MAVAWRCGWSETLVEEGLEGGVAVVASGSSGIWSSEEAKNNRENQFPRTRREVEARPGAH